MSNSVNPVKTPYSKGRFHRINMIIRIDMTFEAKPNSFCGELIANRNLQDLWLQQAGEKASQLIEAIRAR